MHSSKTVKFRSRLICRLMLFFRVNFSKKCNGLAQGQAAVDRLKESRSEMEVK